MAERCSTCSCSTSAPIAARNSPHRQPTLNDEATLLGAAQLAWLKRSPLDSTATWKLIASDMPISPVVADLNPDVPKGMFEAWANADNGPPSGRELEITSFALLIKNNRVKDVVWVTADVYYAAPFAPPRNAPG